MACVWVGFEQDASQTGGRSKEVCRLEFGKEAPKLVISMTKR